MKKLKYLLLILPFIFVSKVNGAVINDGKIFGHHLDGEWSLPANGDRSYTADYFLFASSNGMPNYLYVDLCTTGNAPTVWVTGFGGNTKVSPDTKIYKVNKPCRTGGYNASVYRFTFNITSYDDAGNGNLGLQFNTRLFSNSNYTTYFRILNITYSDTLSYADIELDNSNAIIDTNNKIVDKQTETNNKLDEANKNIKDTNNTLKDDNIDTSKTTIEDKSADASNSPISSLLTLPLKLLNNIHTGLSGTCSALNLGSLLGTDLVLPCINLEQRLGSYLWGLIDYAFCIFLIYNVGMLAVKIWTDVIMMRDFFSELYKPQGEKGGKDK